MVLKFRYCEKATKFEKKKSSISKQITSKRQKQVGDSFQFLWNSQNTYLNFLRTTLLLNIPKIKGLYVVHWICTKQWPLYFFNLIVLSTMSNREVSEKRLLGSAFVTFLKTDWWNVLNAQTSKLYKYLYHDVKVV